MAKKPLRKCGNCKHGGDQFKLPYLGTHLHCGHPAPVIAGEPGWGTLRGLYDTCERWEKITPPKQAAEGGGR